MLTCRLFGIPRISAYVCSMKNLEIVFRLMRRHVSLRLVNLVGLSVVLAAMIVSVNHIVRELSWDRYNVNADRIVRLTLDWEGGPVDGRIYGNMMDDPLRQIPEVEAVAKLHEVYRLDLKYRGTFITAGEKVFYVNRDFLRTFDITMLEGDLQTALSAQDQVIVSESMARRLAGMQDAAGAAARTGGHTGREGKVVCPGEYAGNGGEQDGYGRTGAGGSGRYAGVLQSDLEIEGTVCHITGIFKDIPETSHWSGDVIRLLPESLDTFCYMYLLLLHEKSDIEGVENTITDMVSGMVPENAAPPAAVLMPLTSIHLHSHNLRELSVNGNITYIWLTVGANVLLLVVVLFNLWLNTALIFSYNRRHYQLNRLYGAPVSVILRNEALQSLILAICSVVLGLAASWLLYAYGAVPGSISLWPTAVTVIAFAAVAVAVSMIPAVRSMALTGFSNTERDSRPVHFTYGNVRWMLVVQYAVLTAVLAIAMGIGKQLGTIESVQAGGDGRDVMVMSGLTEDAMAKFPMLKDRLRQSPLILDMTTSFQLPGDAIRDYVEVRRGGSSEGVQVPVMVVGDSFLDFYGIPLLAGEDFTPLAYGFEQEQRMLTDFLMTGRQSGRSEEYIINRAALGVLGFASAEEAIGEPLGFEQGTLDYISQGVITGVADDYNYTGVFVENHPVIMMHRNCFQFCLMVRIDSFRAGEAVRVLNAAWTEVFPERQSDFVPLSDIYGSLYRNEFNARKLVMTFTLLCFVIADLGLIIFMAFIIRRRTKEIAVRKINGASTMEIIRLLNANFIRYICLAFLVAVPVSWYVLHSWLQRFAYKTSLDWWLFALAGLTVLLVSVLSVSLQSWRAATLNPVRGLK